MTRECTVSPLAPSFASVRPGAVVCPSIVTKVITAVSCL